MKILGISGSTRKDKYSGTHKLVKTTLEATGIDYDLISLRGKKIGGCIACLGCVKTNVCVLKDDLREMHDKIASADAYVIGAPNFYSGMNATTHALLERFYQFRHRDGDTLWGKLAVAIGVGGGDGTPVVSQIKNFMSYNFIETVDKVSGQGAACCFTCGFGETCSVGAVQMFFDPGTKITEDIIPNVEKQPELMEAAKQAGIKLAERLKNHDRKATTQKMQQSMMQKFKEST